MTNCVKEKKIYIYVTLSEQFQIPVKTMVEVNYIPLTYMYDRLISCFGTGT